MKAMINKVMTNIKARLFSKPYDIYKEEIVKNSDKRKTSNGYYIYNDELYYGNRFFVFFESAVAIYGKLYEQKQREADYEIEEMNL